MCGGRLGAPMRKQSLVGELLALLHFSQPFLGIIRPPRTCAPPTCVRCSTIPGSCRAAQPSRASNCLIQLVGNTKLG
jgi:hypothetical protein